MILPKHKEEDFDEFRRKGLCGSDIAGICGVSKWVTALDVYKRIKEGTKFGPSDETSAYFGRQMEDVIVSCYCDKREVKVRQHAQIIHDKYPFIRGNTDGLLDAPFVLVEAKNIGPSAMREWKLGDKWIVPAKYRFQCFHYSNILQPERIDVAVLFCGNKLEIITLERNLKFEKAIENKCIDWWEKHIIKNCAPKPTRVSDIDRYVKIIPESTIEITDEIQQKIERIKELNPCVKELKELKDDIKLFMGPHQHLMCKGKVVGTFKEFQVNRFNMQRLKQENRHFFNQLQDDYYDETTSKRLRV